jgi:hypothetical protein
MRHVSVILIALIFIFASCDGDQEEECVFIPEVERKAGVKLISLSDSLAGISSKPELVELLGRYPVLRDHFFKRRDYRNDSVFVNELYRRFTHAHIDTLNLEVQRVFGDVQTLKDEFERGFSNLLYYYPETRIPEIQTVISGLETDMLITDSLIIIGLDYFLGEGAKYRPNMYDYLLRQYTAKNIVPSTLLLFGISDQFNKTNPNDKTVLADMIAYGKAFYFAKHMLPCVPDSILIWYSAEEINGARNNQDLIWNRLIEDQVLYSTNHILKQKFLGDRPKTIEVGEKCPGRIAQWVGWEIVKQYMATHPDVSLPELMNMTDADRLFKESRYRPERQ